MGDEPKKQILVRRKHLMMSHSAALAFKVMNGPICGITHFCPYLFW